MLRIYLGRHGQTENNLKHLFNGGSVDTPLTAKGVADAQAMGRMLANINFAKVVTSAMPRAITTAKLALAESHFNSANDIVTDPRLNEMNLGDWDGVAIDALTDATQMDNYAHHPDKFDGKAIHGESYYDIVKRSTQAMAEMTAGMTTGNILIVSHGILLTFMANALLGNDISVGRQRHLLKNASVSVLTKENDQYTELAFSVLPETLANDPELAQQVFRQAR
ncbi:histidine phosphatase family protein [Agrilactobacillus fermenti]|uniref:histidine phosphatase family protein n=1 Tax=Agrilactobacillus fermenti TaxID=2586909 RepID=UPI001E2A6096|nr:histidine phosphatase family protein [Agrilactobacillus fermenti]MCD2255604.1 histidine phosphatase family protein [Agrilactobacillus fermenti]